MRENLGRAEIFGVESAVAWDALATLRLSASYLYSHGTVDSAPRSRVGRQAARGSARAPGDGRPCVDAACPGARWRCSALHGRQFDDDLNTLPLDPYVTVDASVVWQFAAHWRARASVENLLDTEYQTGRGADGLVSIGAPRLIYGSLHWDY